MAEAKSIPPYRCSYCLQAISEEHEQDFIGSYGTRPTSDDAHNFLTETQRLIRYAGAVASVCEEASTMSEEIAFNLHMLAGELAEEADRRIQLAMDAVEIIEARAEANVTKRGA